LYKIAFLIKTIQRCVVKQKIQTVYTSIQVFYFRKIA